MKKTNVILGIVIAAFIIIAAVILLVAGLSNRESQKAPENVDFVALSNSIEEVTNLDPTKMEEITKEDLVNDFKLDESWIEEYIGEKQYLNISSSMYVIVKTTEENVDNVVNAFKEYGLSYDDMWKDYLTEEYELVKNRQIGSKGNYVYFVVSDYAKEIVDLIK